MWIRGLLAVLLSIGFHVQALYFAQSWLNKPSLSPMTITLQVRLEPPRLEVIKPEDPVLKNTLEVEEGAIETKPQAKLPSQSGSPSIEQIPQRKLEKLMMRLSDSLFYPPEALAQGLEGETVLMVELDTRGRIVQVSVAGSSGYLILDEAAARAVQSLDTLGPDLKSKSVLFPVRFELN